MKAKVKAVAQGDSDGAKFEVVDLDTLTLDPRNIRVHGDRNREILGASFREYGAARSIVVDGKGIVRAGNGTLEAARAAGLDKAIMIDADGDQLVVVRRKDWSNTQAVGYSILDNRATDTSTNDDDALIATIKALEADGVSPDSIGYNSKELDDLIGELGKGPTSDSGETVDDPAGEWQGMPEFEHEDQTAEFKVHVHIRNGDDLKAFEELIGQSVPRDRWAIWHPKAEIGHYKDKRYATDEDDES